MKVEYTNKHGMVLTVEGDTQAELFQQLANAQEVFDEEKCGVCGSEELKFSVRVIDDNKFFEMVCKNRDCRAKLKFGQHKKGGTLFPNRKDADDKFDYQQMGWSKWVPEGKKAEVAQATPAKKGKGKASDEANVPF